jgi:hypothetical protein
LQKVQVGLHAQLPQAAGHPGRAEVQGALLDVLPGGQRLSRRQLAGHHSGVAGLFPEPAYVRIALRGFLALADRLGEGGWQPGGDRGGVLHQLGGGLRGQVQLKAQLDGGELIGGPGPGVPGGIFGNRGHRGPLVPSLLPPGCGDDP